jgi:hypothetical protein
MKDWEAVLWAEWNLDCPEIGLLENPELGLQDRDPHLK